MDRPRRGPAARRREAPGRDRSSGRGRLLELQPELLDAIASHLSVNDLSALAVTATAATPA